MSQSDLITALNNALAAENALAVEIRNIISTFTWSGLPESKRRDVERSLQALAQGPERRARRIKQMIDRL